MRAASHNNGGLGGSWMEDVMGRHVGQIKEELSGVVGVPNECKLKTLMIPEHIAFQVRSSEYGPSRIGRPSLKYLNPGCQDKAPDRCPFSRSHSLDGTPQTLLISRSKSAQRSQI